MGRYAMASSASSSSGGVTRSESVMEAASGAGHCSAWETPYPPRGGGDQPDQPLVTAGVGHVGKAGAAMRLLQCKLGPTNPDSRISNLSDVPGIV